MENENKNENKKESVVSQVVEGKLTVKSLGVIAGMLLAILGAIASGFAFIDNRYVSQEVYDQQLLAASSNLEELEEQTAQLFEAMENQNQQEFNRIYKAIKDGTALPLIVRRDILLARGDRLSSDERAELAILETKLDELNIQ